MSDARASIGSAPTVAIVMARCARRGGIFGVRFQRESPGEWSGTWAFATAEHTARREGYDRTVIDGRFSFADAYPGCPWCEARGLFHCAHDEQHVGCWNGTDTTVRCPWCEKSATIEGTIDRLTSGGDR